jgi:peptidoglycan/LPS O-acetylase OafA/YrhL
MRKPELPALTGIRFYAALAVFLSHVTVLPGMETFSGGRLAFNAGVVGVSFFFVLSGFILTYNYAEHFRFGVSAAGYKRFVWDRLTKIYPVHFATFLLILPIAIASPNLPLDWRAVPFHVLMLQCFWPISNPTFYQYLNVPSWSISCEWFFYLLAPMAMYLALGGMRRWVLVALAVAYAGFLGWFLWHGQSVFTRLYLVSWFAPSRFLEFTAGIWVACVFVNPHWRMLSRLAPLAQVAGIVLLAGGALYRAHAPWPLHGGLLYVPGSALVILGLAFGGGGFANHLSGPWLNRLGLASFALYMVHVPVLRAVKGVCLQLGWEVRTWLAFAAVVAGMFLLIQAIALVLHYAYEIPLQERLRRWARSANGLRLAHTGTQ